LGAKNYSLSKCIKQFRKLLQKAFTPRALHKIPLLNQIPTFIYGSIYKTHPLYIALKKALGNRPFFGGGREDDPSYLTKVALTSTDEGGKRTVVIANYSRRYKSLEDGQSSEDGQCSVSAYEFTRPSNPKAELTCWEAAAASSAATPYFKPFFHSSSRRYFLDGSMKNSNPANILEQERRLIWPDVADRAPDIFLSIGTSQNKSDMQSKMLELPKPSKTRIK